jgi:hypothetical protein
MTFHFGIVDIHTKPYDDMLRLMKAVNDAKYELSDHLSQQPFDPTRFATQGGRCF